MFRTKMRQHKALFCIAHANYLKGDDTIQPKKSNTGKLVNLSFLTIVAVAATLFIAPAIYLGMSQKLTDAGQLADVWGNLTLLTASEDGMVILAVTLLMLVALAFAVAFMGGADNGMTPQTRHITDKILTPARSGQLQHGSADWLERGAFAKVFGVAEIDTESETVKGIMAHGADDLEFPKQQDADKDNEGEVEVDASNEGEPST